MINREIRSGNKEVDSYIISLEDKLSSFGSGNSKRLINQIDNIGGMIADKLDSKQGHEIEVPNELINSYVKLIKSVGDIRDFIKTSDEVFSISKDVVDKTERQVDTNMLDVPEGNKFEEVMRKIKAK